VNPNRPGVVLLSVPIRGELFIMKNQKTENFVFVYIPSCFSRYHSHILSVEEKCRVCSTLGHHLGVFFSHVWSYCMTLGLQN
jgi:hypothetical protein